MDGLWSGKSCDPSQRVRLGCSQPQQIHGATGDHAAASCGGNRPDRAAYSPTVEAGESRRRQAIVHALRDRRSNRKLDEKVEGTALGDTEPGGLCGLRPNSGSRITQPQRVRGRSRTAFQLGLGDGVMRPSGANVDRAGHEPTSGYNPSARQIPGAMGCCTNPLARSRLESRDRQNDAGCGALGH
jgi:hypothetical protein